MTDEYIDQSFEEKFLYDMSFVPEKSITKLKNFMRLRGLKITGNQNDYMISQNFSTDYMDKKSKNKFEKICEEINPHEYEKCKVDFYLNKSQVHKIWQYINIFENIIH